MKTGIRIAYRIADVLASPGWQARVSVRIARHGPGSLSLEKGVAQARTPTRIVGSQANVGLNGLYRAVTVFTFSTGFELIAAGVRMAETAGVTSAVTDALHTERPNPTRDFKDELNFQLVAQAILQRILRASKPSLLSNGRFTTYHSVGSMRRDAEVYVVNAESWLLETS